mmetsp:Transcript_23536/g.56806  ORF Transcript_23536/g.56806 Transcript_23536/m.56806 type:complete len:232 (-) Transcript_23536:752-1447(-)
MTRTRCLTESRHFCASQSMVQSWPCARASRQSSKSMKLPNSMMHMESMVMICSALISGLPSSIISLFLAVLSSSRSYSDSSISDAIDPTLVISSMTPWTLLSKNSSPSLPTPVLTTLVEQVDTFELPLGSSVAARFVSRSLFILTRLAVARASPALLDAGAPLAAPSVPSSSNNPRPFIIHPLTEFGQKHPITGPRAQEANISTSIVLTMEDSTSVFGIINLVSFDDNTLP